MTKERLLAKCKVGQIVWITFRVQLEYPRSKLCTTKGIMLSISDDLVYLKTIKDGTILVINLEEIIRIG